MLVGIMSVSLEKYVCTQATHTVHALISSHAPQTIAPLLDYLTAQLQTLGDFLLHPILWRSVQHSHIAASYILYNHSKELL